MAEVAPEAGPAPTKEKLDELVKSASLQYSLKNFAAAAEFYSQATEVQGQLNGEMAPENAELLYYYGRALYKVAIATSDVLGNKVAKEEKKKSKVEKAIKAEAAAEGSSTGANGSKSEKQDTVESKPYFQLTGDENWTDSEDEEDADAPEAAAEGQDEEQDDFGNAFEAFDIARVLYTKQLETLESDGTDKGKAKAELSAQGKLVRERLADCYNYLVDISFENENFHAAIPDARSSLAIQLEYLHESHEYVTEAYFKLSLALEFASMSKLRTEQANMEVGDSETAKEPEGEIDYELRKEAAVQMEQAISSLESRIKKEESELPNLPEDKKKAGEANIKDSKEMLEDMKTRLTDLRADPKQEFDPAQSIDASVFQGLLGGIIGADPSQQKAVLDEASKSANDISGLVRTKKKEKAPAATAETSSEASGSKRKLEVEDDGENGKRAKTEEI
ncbi:hypothetical protein EJ04DRAFT_512310 [Polyplosphaeria fusca]|uniref:Tetratricopeptide SHNi-TPR domain-containing protein n=1 Tax=Polyplosphaeria fusca TaxID=682080 RepID=A0A9P4V2Y3_9PLEO|nr:hypothetical protein EJ04DRAFT_512310 [Polyplosphaeria fusca]